jgi:hypothetical protein
VTLAVTVDFSDTLTKIPDYLFGDNANLWTGCMSDNKTLMKYMADRNMGVLRSPGGSISDVFFWNRNVDQRPADVPNTLVGSTEVNWPWYGDRPYPWETWTMDVDSFYSILPDRCHRHDHSKLRLRKVRNQCKSCCTGRPHGSRLGQV